MPLEIWQVLMHAGFLVAVYAVGMLMAYPKFESRLQR
jgi:hypothetical protein